MASEFCKFYGQSLVLDELKRSFGSREVAHGFLLTGVAGSGKRMLARLCAKALLCQGKERPCGACDACKRVAQNAHPDYIEVQTEKQTIGVEEIRSALDILAEKPYEGGKRTVLILKPMTVQAQNALLKILEEPPAGTVFFITAVNVAAVLPTIASRTRIIQLSPLPEQLCIACLTEHGIETQRAQLLARLSGGVVGNALAMQKDERYWQMRELAFQTAQPFLENQIFDRIALLKNIKELSGVFLDCMETLFSDILRYETGAQFASVDKKEQLASMAEAYRVAGAARMLDALSRARACLTANLSWQSVSEMIVFEIAEVLN